METEQCFQRQKLATFRVQYNWLPKDYNCDDGEFYQFFSISHNFCHKIMLDNLWTAILAMYIADGNPQPVETFRTGHYGNIGGDTNVSQSFNAM